MKRLSIAVSLAILMWACDGGSRSSTPTSPSPPAARPTYTLSGVVSAETPTGLAPVEGVFVQENLRQRAITDANGFYTISGLSTLNNTIQARKAGYDLVTRILAINGDTRFDIHLVRRATYTLSGVVSEVTPTGLAPVEGVLIEELTCDPVFSEEAPPYVSRCGTNLSQRTTTDKNGFYSISGLYAGQNFVWAFKEGYQDGLPESPPCGDEGCRSVTVNGDTRFDIQLVRR